MTDIAIFWLHISIIILHDKSIKDDKKWSSIWDMYNIQFDKNWWYAIWPILLMPPHCWWGESLLPYYDSLWRIDDTTSGLLHSDKKWKIDITYFISSFTWINAYSGNFHLCDFKILNQNWVSYSCSQKVKDTVKGNGDISFQDSPAR